MGPPAGHLLDVPKGQSVGSCKGEGGPSELPVAWCWAAQLPGGLPPPHLQQEAACAKAGRGLRVQVPGVGREQNVLCEPGQGLWGSLCLHL